MQEVSNVRNLLQQTIEAVKEAGAFIREESKHLQVVEEKSRNSLVTKVDKETERRLIQSLHSIEPSAGIIGEEETGNIRNESLNWIIDPLDGTTNFIHGIPCYGISVALASNTDILLGVVYEINLDECFWAYQNGGAYMNGKKITVNEVTDLRDCLLATGFPYYDYEKMDDYLQLLNEFMKQTRGLRRLGSAAVDLAYVACGRFDGFYEYSLHPWDVAAGALLVKEAGGKVTDFKGGDNFLFGREIAASSLAIHSNFLEVIQKYFKK